LASEGLCKGKRTLLHSGCDNRCFVREGQDKKQGVGGEIIIGKGLAFGACRCWKEDDLLLQCPQWHLATFPDPSTGGWAGGGSAAHHGISVPSMGKACWGLPARQPRPGCRRPAPVGLSLALKQPGRERITQKLSLNHANARN